MPLGRGPREAVNDPALPAAGAHEAEDLVIHRALAFADDLQREVGASAMLGRLNPATNEM